MDFFFFSGDKAFFPNEKTPSKQGYELFPHFFLKNLCILSGLSPSLLFVPLWSHWRCSSGNAVEKIPHFSFFFSLLCLCYGRVPNDYALWLVSSSLWENGLVFQDCYWMIFSCNLLVKGLTFLLSCIIQFPIMCWLVLVKNKITFLQWGINWEECVFHRVDHCLCFSKNRNSCPSCIQTDYSVKFNSAFIWGPLGVSLVLWTHQPVPYGLKIHSCTWTKPSIWFCNHAILGNQCQGFTPWKLSILSLIAWLWCKNIRNCFFSGLEWATIHHIGTVCRGGFGFHRGLFFCPNERKREPNPTLPCAGLSPPNLNAPCQPPWKICTLQQSMLKCL